MNFTEDEFLGTSGTPLPSHAGEVGAAWTVHPTAGTSSSQLTGTGSLRNAVLDQSIYYSSGVPSSADYSVTGNLVSKGTLNGVSVAGVIGRASTSAATYYGVQYAMSGGNFTDDTFTGTVGTSLVAHTGEVGATWTVHEDFGASIAKLTGTGALMHGGAATSSLLIMSGVPATANYTVNSILTVRGALTGVSVAGVTGRTSTTEATFYGVQYVSNLAEWQLYKAVDGAYTILGTYPQVLAADTAYPHSLAMQGSTIRLLTGGVERVSVTDTAIPAAGRVGVSFYNSTGVPTATDGYHLESIYGVNANLGFQLYKAVAGTYTVLGSYTPEIVTDTDYPMVLNMLGSTIKMLVGGVERVSVTDTAITAAGRAGVSFFNSTAIPTATDGLHLKSFIGATVEEEAGGDPPTLTGIAIPADGTHIALTFDKSVVGVLAGDYKVLAGGLPMGVESVTGVGSSWKLNFGLRWAGAGQTVKLAYTGTATKDSGNNALATFANAAVTNNSLSTDAVKNLVGFGRGLDMHFSMCTYYPNTPNQWCNGTENINVFYPTNLDIDQWIACAKALGARFIQITTKHVDGFALWVTSTTSRGIKDTTWFASTPINILAEFCTKARAAGLGVSFYYSMSDYGYEIANPSYNNASYTAFTVAQLTELLSRFGKIENILFDAWNTADFPTFTQIDKATIIALCRSLQPDMSIGINTYEGVGVPPTQPGDYPLWEYPIHGAINGHTKPSAQWDVIQHNDVAPFSVWFYEPTTSLRSKSELQATLVNANANGAPYILSVPPAPNGKIPEAFFRRAAEVGASIAAPNIARYGVRNPLAPGRFAS